MIDRTSLFHGRSRNTPNLFKNWVQSPSASERLSPRNTDLNSNEHHAIVAAGASNGGDTGPHVVNIAQSFLTPLRQGVTHIGAPINPDDDISASGSNADDVTAAANSDIQLAE